MAIVDKQGNTIPTESKGILEYVRNNRQHYQQRSIHENVERNASVGNALQRAIATNGDTDTNGDGSYQNSTIAGRSATQSNNGRNEDTRSGETGAYAGISTNRSSSSQSTGSDSSLYQYDRSSGKQQSSTRTYGATTAQRVKNTFSNLSNVVKEHRQEQVKQKKGTKTVESNKRLTDAEALKLRRKIIDFFLWTSEHMDKFIQATTKGHEEVDIWSNMTEAECEILADFFLERAKVNAGTARLVRNMAVFTDRIKAVVIVTPRMYRTAMTYIKRGFSLR